VFLPVTTAAVGGAYDAVAAAQSNHDLTERVVVAMDVMKEILNEIQESNEAIKVSTQEGIQEIKESFKEGSKEIKKSFKEFKVEIKESNEWLLSKIKEALEELKQFDGNISNAKSSSLVRIPPTHSRINIFDTVSVLLVVFDNVNHFFGLVYKRLVQLVLQ
jgi:hypothetical protein